MGGKGRWFGIPYFGRPFSTQYGKGDRGHADRHRPEGNGTGGDQANNRKQKPQQSRDIRARLRAIFDGGTLFLFVRMSNFVRQLADRI